MHLTVFTQPLVLTVHLLSLVILDSAYSHKIAADSSGSSTGAKNQVPYRTIGHPEITCRRKAKTAGQSPTNLKRAGSDSIKPAPIAFREQNEPLEQFAERNKPCGIPHLQRTTLWNLH